MITLSLIILMFIVLTKLIVLAIKLSWGITKVAFYSIFLPVLLIAGIACGLFALVIPTLIILALIGISFDR